jgi:hypothetical protein
VAIRFACESCGQLYKAGEQFAGAAFSCKGCGRDLVVPPLCTLGGEFQFDAEGLERYLRAVRKKEERRAAEEGTSWMAASRFSVKSLYEERRNGHSFHLVEGGTHEAEGISCDPAAG